MFDSINKVKDIDSESERKTAKLTNIVIQAAPSKTNSKLVIDDESQDSLYEKIKRKYMKEKPSDTLNLADSFGSSQNRTKIVDQELDQKMKQMRNKAS